MSFILSEFTELHAKDVCTWKYDNEYAIYNMPSWEDVCLNKWAFSINDKRKQEFHALVDESSNLIAYIRVQDKDIYILIGLGLKPELCSQGLGKQLMDITRTLCSRHYPNKKLCLEVRSFNQRAIRCYKSAGFIQTDTYIKETPLGKTEFIRMEYSTSI
jgi:ribosomal protein S18 acetylase RimI-like enzyme